METTRLLLSTNLISSLHAQSLSSLAAVQSTGRLATSLRIDRPGVYRHLDVIIKNSPHVPPHAELVPHLIYNLCDYMNANWSDMDPADAAGIVLWRINWIHPFRDGNGRTARAVTRHVVDRYYNSNLGTAFDQRIVANRSTYYQALRAEDQAQGHAGSIMLPGISMHAFMREIIDEP